MPFSLRIAEARWSSVKNLKYGMVNLSDYFEELTSRVARIGM